MDIRNLEEILYDQQLEVEAQTVINYCHRSEESYIDFESPLAQVVLGVRRSGKSTLCLNALVAANIKFGYVNFDDERLMDMETADLNSMLEVLYKIHGDVQYFFFDEIQNVQGWPLFVNRLLRQGKHVVITGSNAKLLDTDLATHLTGRNNQIMLYPFSFEDYCRYKQLKLELHTTLDTALIRAAFDEYMKQGGFPELFQVKDKRQYINGLFHDILHRDIKERFKIRYIKALEMLANYLLDVSPTLLVKNKLKQMFNIQSVNTVANYITYLEKSYLISSLHQYSPKSRLRLTGEKCYAIDVALMDNRNDAFSGENFGWRLETIVYLELKRRTMAVGEDVYYYRTTGSVKRECDFIVCRGNNGIMVVQVAYSLATEKTRRREIAGAIAGAEQAGCNKIFIITDHEREVIQEQNKIIQVLPIYEFLLRLNK